MMQYLRLKNRFVKYIPEHLEPGLLYVSMEYATAVHSCCCGCGQEVVTPFTPIGWKMTFDGETISIWPSVGNWETPCRSHYIIRNGEVIEAAPWTDAEIAAERRRDKEAKALYYNASELTKDVEPIAPTRPSTKAPERQSRLKSWLSKLLSK